MRKILIFGSLTALMIMVTNQADAQRPGGGGGRGMGGRGGPMMYLVNKGVQEELKVTPEQKEKIDAASKESFSKMGEIFTKFKDLPKEERSEKMQAAMKEINDNAMKEIALKPEQAKRLKQIEIQQNPLATFVTNEEVAKELKITDEQKTKLKDLRETSDKDLAEMRKSGGGGKGGFNKEAQEKMAAARKEASDKALKMLTAEQLGKWKELTGEPFVVKFEFGGGRKQPAKEPKE